MSAHAEFERVVRRHGAKAHLVLDVWTEIWPNPAFAGWERKVQGFGVFSSSRMLVTQRPSAGQVFLLWYDRFDMEGRQSWFGRFIHDRYRYARLVPRRNG